MAATLTKERPEQAVSLEECIQRRAYELYVERGNQSGSELNDWLQAEEQIRQGQVQKAEGKENIRVVQGVRRAFGFIFFLSAFLRRLCSARGPSGVGAK